MKMHFVDTDDQVLQIALESPLPSIEEAATQPIAPLRMSGSITDVPTAYCSKSTGS